MKRFLIVVSMLLSACDTDDDGGDNIEASGSSESTDALPICGGDVPMFESCNYDCDCADGNSCRYNYAGGYLAECTAECSTDDDCDAGSCSGGWCVQLCGADRSCEADTWCYPGALVDGTPLVDPMHPEAHCMTKACRQLGGDCS